MITAEMIAEALVDQNEKQGAFGNGYVDVRDLSDAVIDGYFDLHGLADALNAALSIDQISQINGENENG